MNISGLQYNLERKTLEIYISGCNGRCEGCHNYELWDFNVGKYWSLYLDKIESDIKSGMVDEIWVLGGDPMDQDYMELYRFIAILSNYGRRIWLWTRHPLESIPVDLRKLFAYVKTGEYRKDLPGYKDEETGVELASNNQKIHRIWKN